MPYLLGELSEREQADLEARYFEDSRVFDELTQVESALIDDYVRGRLAPAIRQRFESHFMADPRRGDRVRFAAALTRTIDRTNTQTEPPVEASATSAAGSWLDWIRTPRFAMAFATLLALVVIGTWLVVNTRRAREELATRPGVEEERQAGAVRPSPAPPARTPDAAAAPQPVLAVATLALLVGPGERAVQANEPSTLTIPPGTDQVRFALTLREHDYARYRVIVRIIGGAEVLRQDNLVPATAGAQLAFTVTAPAARFEPGDYLLTLQGATAGDEYEDLSLTIFRITRQP